MPACAAPSSVDEAAALADHLQFDAARACALPLSVRPVGDGVVADVQLAEALQRGDHRFAIDIAARALECLNRDLAHHEGREVAGLMISSFAAGGLYVPEPAILAKVRQEIDYSFDEWKKIVTDKTFKKYQQTWSKNT